MEGPESGNRVEKKEGIRPYYTALFVEDINSLLESFPPKHEKIYGHHSTIAFKPGSLDGLEIGHKLKIKVIGRAWDEKGDALLVENPKSKIAHPHITLSSSKGVPAQYSNELIDAAVAAGTVEYLDEPIEIEVVEGYSDGGNDITEVPAV